ncbi:DUF2130 domain-containing protein [Patescibacteria group bacterium]|nr:DUF2130 domain-containing protein [Patescibacteria group bacterium]
MNHVVCPHCGKHVEIADAIKHQIEESVRSSEEEKHKIQLEKFKKEIEEKAEKRVKEDLDLKLKDSASELEETKKRNKELQSQLLELTKSIRGLRGEFEKKELENEKKINAQIEENSKTISEKARLRELELEKKLNDTQKALEDAQRKTRQGSQQLQGEILELDLEKKLKETFVYDDFLPVPKGVEGADIWQKVKNKHEQEAGSIIWEIKSTKAFSKSWLPKLREDARKINASESILVTGVLPDGIKYYGRESGVWICGFDYALILANVLRYGLMQTAIAKSAAAHEDENLQEIYDYIISEAFRHKIEAHFESVKSLKEDLDSEKRVMERVWKKREVQINRLDRSMSQMFGELQGVTGAALTPPKSMEPSQIESGEKIEQEELL